MIVDSNTTPLNYLILVAAEGVLPRLFECVLAPPAVLVELSHSAAPLRVRDWLAQRPGWLEVIAPPGASDPALASLDDGEREAIILAEAEGADLLLMDERDGVKVARGRGLTVVGTLGVLDRAAEEGIIDLPSVVADLRATTFRAAPSLLDALLEQDAQRRQRR